MTSTAEHEPSRTSRTAALLDALQRNQRAIAALDAERATLLAAAGAIAHEHAATQFRRGPQRDLPLRSMAAEIAAATRTGDRTVQGRIADAEVLVASFAATLAALAAGEITSSHVHVITDAGLPIADTAVRAGYEQAALDVARRETPGRLRPIARMLAARADAECHAERHDRARRRRGVWITPGDDGMAELTANLPAHLAHGIHDRLTNMARSVIEARAAARGDDPAAESCLDAGASLGTDEPPRVHDTRALGEVRADVFADLLLTGHASAADVCASIPAQDAVRARVQVTIAASTLIGADDQPAELVGNAPIDASAARRLAATSPHWERLLVHPITGSLHCVDRYRPTGAQRRLLAARDEHCRFSGCRQPTWRCDIDHTVARAHDGPTEIQNLAHLCRRHHVLKHQSAWRVRQRPDGTLEWTSPTGRRYDDIPARTLTFQAATAEPESPPPF